MSPSFSLLRRIVVIRYSVESLVNISFLLAISLIRSIKRPIVTKCETLTCLRAVHVLLVEHTRFFFGNFKELFKISVELKKGGEV